MNSAKSEIRPDAVGAVSRRPECDTSPKGVLEFKEKDSGATRNNLERNKNGHLIGGRK
jgi:hypothetical protein